MTINEKLLIILLVGLQDELSDETCQVVSVEAVHQLMQFAPMMFVKQMNQHE